MSAPGSYLLVERLWLPELFELFELPELFELLLLTLEDELLLRPWLLLLLLCELAAEDEDRVELDDLVATDGLEAWDLLTVDWDRCVDDCDLVTAG